MDSKNRLFLFLVFKQQTDLIGHGSELFSKGSVQAITRGKSNSLHRTKACSSVADVIELHERNTTASRNHMQLAEARVRLEDGCKIVVCNRRGQVEQQQLVVGRIVVNAVLQMRANSEGEAYSSHTSTVFLGLLAELIGVGLEHALLVDEASLSLQNQIRLHLCVANYLKLKRITKYIQQDGSTRPCRSFHSSLWSHPQLGQTQSRLGP